MAYEKWSADEKMRREAKRLYKIEVIFRAGPETKQIHLKNVMESEFQDYRKTFFSSGLGWRDPEVKGHGFVIPPFDIVSIEYWVQDSFIEP